MRNARPDSYDNPPFYYVAKDGFIHVNESAMLKLRGVLQRRPFRRGSFDVARAHAHDLRRRIRVGMRGKAQDACANLTRAHPLCNYTPSSPSAVPVLLL